MSTSLGEVTVEVAPDALERFTAIIPPVLESHAANSFDYARRSMGGALRIASLSLERSGREAAMQRAS
jgi:hypothetical protein